MRFMNVPYIQMFIPHCVNGRYFFPPDLRRMVVQQPYRALHIVRTKHAEKETYVAVFGPRPPMRVLPRFQIVCLVCRAKDFQCAVVDDIALDYGAEVRYWSVGELVLFGLSSSFFPGLVYDFRPLELILFPVLVIAAPVALGDDDPHGSVESVEVGSLFESNLPDRIEGVHFPDIHIRSIHVPLPHFLRHLWVLDSNFKIAGKFRSIVFVVVRRGIGTVNRLRVGEGSVQYIPVIMTFLTAYTVICTYIGLFLIILKHWWCSTNDSWDGLAE